MNCLEYIKLKLIELNLENQSVVNNSIIIKTVLEELIEIKEEIIDINSIVKIDINNLEIRLISTSNYFVPIYINVFGNNIIDIQIDEGGEYLFLQEIKNWTDLRKLRETLRDLLHNEINCEYHFLNDKLIKVNYSIPYYTENGENVYNFALIKGSGWFWQKEKVIKKTFKKWIE